MVNPVYAVMRAFANSATVGIVNEQLLENGRNATMNEVMDNSVSKIGSENFTFYRFIHNKADARLYRIPVFNNFTGKFKNVRFRMLLKCQCILR